MQNNEVNWDEILIHSSSLGVLFVEPKDAAAKKAGELSQTAKSHLIKVYIRHYWGRSKDLLTKHMEKGLLVEEDALTILSRVDKRFYKKNTERKSNLFITGEADIEDDEIVIDTKASWDAETFLPKLLESIDRMYFIQLQGYMWLWNKPKAKLSYCLVNTPEKILNKEKYYLLKGMDVPDYAINSYLIGTATLTDIVEVCSNGNEVVAAVKELERNMIFDDIPIEERVISHEVLRDAAIIAQIPKKVQQARNFLKYFYDKHSLHRKTYLRLTA